MGTQIFGQSAVGNNRFTPRHAVFGIVTDGPKIAVVSVSQATRSYFDLPGGGVVPGETEEAALVREFKEETGLIVTPQVRLHEVGQHFCQSNGRDYVFNYGGVWTAVVEGQGPNTEANHELQWLEPAHAIASFRHESHAWIIVMWLRWKERRL